MAMSPSFLLKKIKMNLGLRSLPMIRTDDEILDIIYTETIPTFSNFFPYMVETTVDLTEANMVDETKDTFYIFDENNNFFGEDIEILGIKELKNRVSNRGGSAYTGMDAVYGMNTIDNMLSNIAFSGITSLMNSGSLFGLYEFLPPNKIRLPRGPISNFSTIYNNKEVPVTLFCTHPKSLTTIPQTKLEFFYELCDADVKRVLYEELRRYKNIDTTYGEIDMQIDEWQDTDMSRRKDLIDKMRNTYLLDNQPKIIAF